MANVPLCSNWACPANRSCARHFGRSREYGAILTSGVGVLLRAFNPEKGCCGEYVCDQPQAWLLSWDMQARLSAAIVIGTFLRQAGRMPAP